MLREENAPSKIPGQCLEARDQKRAAGGSLVVGYRVVLETTVWVWGAELATKWDAQPVSNFAKDGHKRPSPLDWQ